jgi:acetyl esterase/lipase
MAWVDRFSQLLSKVQRARPLPGAWTGADVLPLWPGSPPGGAQFAPRPLPAGWPPEFVRNVAAPQLRVFRAGATTGAAGPAGASGPAGAAEPAGAPVLVLPGGAYEFVAVANEGMDIAARLTALGHTVFVLTYRLPAEGWSERTDVPLQDAQRAMRLIRSQAAAFGIDAQRLSTLGFSAGGHLAATLATAHAESVYQPVDAADQLSARPFATGLVYPVITMDITMTEKGLRERLLGPDPDAALIGAYSAERHVDAATPPCFLAHACDDDSVPLENTLRFVDAMRKANRPVEAHLFQEGEHAFGVGRPGTPTAAWIELFSVWLGRLGVAHEAG